MRETGAMVGKCASRLRFCSFKFLIRHDLSDFFDNGAITSPRAAAPPALSTSGRASGSGSSSGCGPASASAARVPRKMNTYACSAPGCAFTAKYPSLLRLHERRHTGERPFPCSMGCTATFPSRTAQLRHERGVHARATHVVCPAPGCGFIAANDSAMVSHARKLGHGASIRCPFSNCDLRFNSGEARRKHLKCAAHAGVGGTSVCGACGATFAMVADYTAHVREHTRVRLLNALARKRSDQGAGAVDI